jgi:NAD(P)-dependent dehydrogenase (short-subunit alcohol dehydrogenase family)
MARSARWTFDDVPDLSGRTVVVTGGNSGIGFEAALGFARKGGEVVLACRDLAKARAASAAIRGAEPRAVVEPMQLDLASIASVRRFAADFTDRRATLDVLCNNAGVMAVPRHTTADGFEMQLGTNHLGHFALTGLLLDRLLAAPRARIVTVSSNAHKLGRIRFDDLHGRHGYKKWDAYGQSKLANLLFSYELQRRLAGAGARAISVACHPGYAATNLQLTGPRMARSAVMERVWKLANRLFSQSAARGALPTLYAATSPDVAGGDYVGPDRFFENLGHPRKAQSSPRSHDHATAARLWEVSAELTGVRYEALATTGSQAEPSGSLA